jgi:hypothetical protein
MSTSQSWEDYEAVARFLVHELREKLGLARVEGKQKVAGDSGTEWEIDAKAVTAPNAVRGGAGSVPAEPRRGTCRWPFPLRS